MSTAKVTSAVPATLVQGPPARPTGRAADPSEIPCFLPEDEGFAHKTQVYTREANSTPSAVVCPRTAGEVAQVIRHAVKNDVPFTVRALAHDLWARSLAEGALCVDVRALDSVTVSADRKTATLGGGVVMKKVMTTLAEQGLVTPCAINGAGLSIGYVGWASMGGWGSLNNHFGFGADQIVAATLVNANGDIINADDAMLKGIRGGGAGNVGVVVDITVKVYELQKVLAGVIVLDSAMGVGEAFTAFAAGLQDLRDSNEWPSEVDVEPFIAALPGRGPSVCASFISSSADLNVGSSCLDKVLALAPVAINEVKELSVSDWASGPHAGENWEYGQWGRVLAVNVASFSPRVLDTMRQVATDMPADSGAAIYVRALGAESPSVSGRLGESASLNPELRQPHFMIELAGNTLDKSRREEVTTWAQESYRALRTCPESLSAAHPAMLALEDQTPENVFGSNLEGLRELKATCDPAFAFKNAVPKLW